MKILLNGLQAGNRSGTGRYTESLIAALLQEDNPHDYHVLWPSSYPAPDVWAERANIIPCAASPVMRISESHRYCVSGQYDLVHHLAGIGTFRSSGPTVLSVHDLSCFHYPEWFSPTRSLYYRFAIKRSVALADRIIAVSESTAADIQEWLAVDSDTITVVPHGVDAHFQPLDREQYQFVFEQYALPERFLLYVGTLEPRKNVARLIAAWDSVADEVPDLVIAGRWGWRYGGIRAALSQATHQDRIHLPGFLPEEDLPAVISAATGFVWPSLFEGFGLPVLEAMACGTPLLTSNTGSIPEVTGDTAWLADPWDEASIASGLVQLVSGGGVPEKAAQALQRAQRFSWETAAAQTRHCYERFATGGSRVRE